MVWTKGDNGDIYKDCENKTRPTTRSNLHAGNDRPAGNTGIKIPPVAPEINVDGGYSLKRSQMAQPTEVVARRPEPRPTYTPETRKKNTSIFTKIKKLLRLG